MKILLKDGTTMEITCSKSGKILLKGPYIIGPGRSSVIEIKGFSVEVGKPLQWRAMTEKGILTFHSESVIETFTAF